MANHVNFGRVARPESSKGVGSPAHPQRSFSKAAFVRALQRLLPDTRAEHLHPAPSGVLKLSAETASWSTTLRSWRTISSYTCSTPLRPPRRRH